jgi:AcrR family transcriptional regulator
LKVAASLFAEQGFDSVSINDVGIAAGITGPAVYRYFASKEALLVSIYEHLYRRTGDGIDEILSSGVTGRAELAGLIDLQLQLAIEEPEKIRIVNSEERHLPVKEADRLRVQRRRMLSVWTDVLRQVRPDLGRGECDATVHGVLALINSISLRRSPDPVSPAIREHLRVMATGAAFATSAPMPVTVAADVRTA